MIRVPAEWNIREKLCLATCVMKHGENEWNGVSKSLRGLTNEDRPADYYSSKNCAQQYTALLETMVAPRKRRSELSGVTTGTSGVQGSPATQIVSKLTMQRIEELKKIIQAEHQQFRRIKKEIETITSGKVDHQVPYLHQQAVAEYEAAGLTEDDPEYQEIYAKLSEAMLSNQSLETVAMSKLDESNDGEPMEQDLQAEISRPSAYAPVTAEPPPLFEESSGSGKGDEEVEEKVEVKEEVDELVEESGGEEEDEPLSNLKKTKIENVFKEPIATSKLKDDQVTENIVTEKPSEFRSPSTEEPALKLRISLTKNKVVQSSEEQVSSELVKPVLPVKEVHEKETRGERGRTSPRKKVAEEKQNESQKKVESPSKSTRLRRQSDTIEPETITKNVNPIDEPLVSPTRSGRKKKPAKSEETENKEVEVSTPTRSSRSSRSISSESPTKPVAASVPSPSKGCHGKPAAAVEERKPQEQKVLHKNNDTSCTHALPPDWTDDSEYKLWKQRILTIWRVISGHRHANLFISPVTDKIAENYSNIVFSPMDLGTLKKMVESGEVRSTLEFRKNLLLMFANAVMYNHSMHFVNTMAKEMATETLEMMDTTMNPEHADKCAADLAKSRRSGRFAPHVEMGAPPALESRGVSATPSTPRASMEREPRKRSVEQSASVDSNDDIRETPPPAKRSRR